MLIWHLSAQMDGWPCYVFDKAFKKLHFDQLNPSKFRQKELGAWLMKFAPAFGDNGKAMLDGISIIHKYLELMDDNSVVILRIA